MKAFVMVFASVCFASIAAATDTPRFETYFGFDWVKFHPAVADIPSFNAEGGSAQFAYNISRGIGIAFDVGSVSKDTFTGVLSNRQTHFLIGPRFAYHNHSRFTPFGEVLFGAVNGSVSLNIDDINRLPTVLPSSIVTLPDNVSVRLTASRTSFAMMAGGGLDIRVTKHLAYRLFDADYFLCRPTSLISGEDVNKNNARITTGLNFTWGAR